jgi:hypothetical protein
MAPINNIPRHFSVGGLNNRLINTRNGTMLYASSYVRRTQVHVLVHNSLALGAARNIASVLLVRHCVILVAGGGGTGQWPLQQCNHLIVYVRRTVEAD